MENPDSGATPRRVAFLGLGIMGWPMAANLARAGFELAVWTRTGEKAERFAAEHGARGGATPAEAAEGADAVISMVVDAPEVEAVLLGDDGAAQALRRGALCIDMSTIAPSAALAIGGRLRERGLGSWTRRSPARGRGRRRAASRSWSGRPRTTSPAPTAAGCDGRAGGARRTSGARRDDQGDRQHGHGDQRGGPGRGARDGGRRRPRHRALPRGGRRGLERLDHARAEGAADGRAGTSSRSSSSSTC